MMPWSSSVHPSTDFCCVWGFERLGGDAVCHFAQPDHCRDRGNQHRGVCVGRNSGERQGSPHEAQTGQFIGEQWPNLGLWATKIRWSGFSSQLLYGHTDSVTCLAASEVHSLIVSGSRDLTCILWDMEELSYITQLTGHTAGISSLAINDLTVSSAHSPTAATVFLSALLNHWRDYTVTVDGVDILIFIVSLLLLFPLCIFVTPSCLCERVKLHHARGHFSTCGTWKVNCSHAAIPPLGHCQTSCASPSRSATSGIPETWSSPAVQMASYGWGFLLWDPLMPLILLCGA